MKWKFIKIQSDTDTTGRVTISALEPENSESGFYPSLGQMNWIFLELETYEVESIKIQRQVGDNFSKSHTHNIFQREENHEFYKN